MFTWKRHKDIFKGEGIYHLTFAVHDRAPILGTLVGDASSARVELSAIGFDISYNIQQLPSFFPAVKVCAKLLMPDHIHVVLWVQKEHPYSIKEVGRSMRQAWHKIIRSHISEQGTLVSISPQIESAGEYKNENSESNINENYKNENRESIINDNYKNENTPDNEAPMHLPYRFEVPYIRTLVAQGQLNRMIAYIHDNPRRAMLRRLNPDLFRLRREVQADGLTFTAMGNLFLLDYPQKQAVVCSRSTSAEGIAAQQAACMQAAEAGAGSYSGVVSAGEKQIARAIREAGLPMVVLLNDGFPSVGSEHERFYKPGGVYFEACAAGRLLLLEATAATMDNPRIVALTDQALHDKAEAKHQDYTPLPHTSLRWRMMANNTIVELLANGER